MSAPRVSIIITSYNYERFLAATIDSALAQTHPDTEVIVVDDGSTDDSPAVIARYGDQIVPVLKDNGGQASAINAGFATSSGAALIFLDSDDLLLPGAASAITEAFSDHEVAKAHWSMPIIDARGSQTGRVQDPELAEGDLRELVLREGPLSDMTMPSPDMSGNAFPRWFVERVMPIPQRPYRTMADEYLFGLAPAFGPIARLPPQSLKRTHGENALTGWSFERMLAFQTEHQAIVAGVVAEVLRRDGLVPDVEGWKRSSWWLRTARVVRAIEAAIPVGERLALVDEGSLGVERELRGRIVVPFPEAENEFAGSPGSDEDALAELARVQPNVPYYAIAWPAFWWLDEYPGLASALHERNRLIVEDEDVMIFGPVQER